MFIKKHQNKNQYILSNGIYVRDLTSNESNPVDINSLSNTADQQLFIDNEFENYSQRYVNIDNEEIFHPFVAIVSDGYDFAKKHKILSQLPKDVTIIGVNKSLKRWTLVGEMAEQKRSINYYVVNNPYDECLNYLPNTHRYYPKCIASSRTNPEFLKSYSSRNKYIYSCVEDEFYSGVDRKPAYKIDDYRNPICAAISLAYKFKAIKILLFCCDDSFEDERPASEKLDNGLWRYPQQKITHGIIDSMCYWLKLKKIKIADHSSDAKYLNATYINRDEDILEYFTND